MTTDKKFAELQERIEKLEAVVFAKKSGEKRSATRAIPEEFKGAPGGVRFLSSKGYFKTPRRFGEIIAAAEAEGYLYSKQAIQNALTRMAKVGGPLVTLRRGGGKVYAERK